MSGFRETSEITGLNRRAGDALGSLPSRRLLAAMTACDRAYRLTDGRFDPRVLTALERLGDRGASIGRADGSVAPGRAPGGRIVEREAGGRVRLSEPIDLGGIGKGLAFRWAASAVRRAGFTGFLIDAGGDLVASGQPPDGGP
jgi:thiamine biosynthesis lipoprotein